MGPDGTVCLMRVFWVLGCVKVNSSSYAAYLSRFGWSSHGINDSPASSISFFPVLSLVASGDIPTTRERETCDCLANDDACTDQYTNHFFTINWSKCHKKMSNPIAENLIRYAKNQTERFRIVSLIVYVILKEFFIQFVILKVLS